jgi:predicted transcriptional regulator
MPCLLTEDVLKRITKRPSTALELADFFHVDKGTIYRHTAILLKQELIVSAKFTEQNGTRVQYSVATPNGF